MKVLKKFRPQLLIALCAILGFTAVAKADVCYIDTHNVFVRGQLMHSFVYAGEQRAKVWTSEYDGVPQYGDMYRRVVTVPFYELTDCDTGLALTYFEYYRPGTWAYVPGFVLSYGIYGGGYYPVGYYPPNCGFYYRRSYSPYWTRYGAVIVDRHRTYVSSHTTIINRYTRVDNHYNSTRTYNNNTRINNNSTHINNNNNRSPISNPVRSQRSFETRDRTPVRSGGFGHSSSPAPRSSPSPSRSYGSSGGFGRPRH